jgi:hypothetical protein
MRAGDNAYGTLCEDRESTDTLEGRPLSVSIVSSCFGTRVRKLRAILAKLAQPPPRPQPFPAPKPAGAPSLLLHKKPRRSMTYGTATGKR